MKLRSAELAERREQLLARIAAERFEFEQQMLVWRRPLHAFDLARQAGERLRGQASVLIVILGAVMLVTRARFLRKVVSGLRWVRWLARWGALGTTLWRIRQGLARNRTAPFG